MRAEFDESLVTGNEMIDTQHKELIDKINKLLDSCETSKEKVVAVKTALAEHKKAQDTLRAVVNDLHKMLEEEEGPSEAFVEQVNKNVIEWLYRHIKGFDRSVAEYKFMNESSERL